MQTIPANQLLAGLTLAEPVAIRAVVTDSRKVEPGCVFVCFPGERVDGHDYAARCLPERCRIYRCQPSRRGRACGAHGHCAGQRQGHDPHGVQLPDAVQPQNDRRHGQRRQDDDEGVLLRGALRLRQDPQDRGQPEQ